MPSDDFIAEFFGLRKVRLFGSAVPLVVDFTRSTDKRLGKVMPGCVFGNLSRCTYIGQQRNGLGKVGHNLLINGSRLRTGELIFHRYGGGKFQDRKSTRLNSSHVKISYAVFCLK